MDQQVGSRRVRNALSVLFGLLTLLVCVLWVRSYYRVDVLYGNLPGVGGFEVYSGDGWLELIPGPRNRSWWIGSQSIEDRRNRVETIRQFNLQMAGPAQGAGLLQGTGPILRMPVGILAVAFGLALALVQVKRPPRFSLRTLLVATMLVAGVLGLGVWLARG